MKHTIAKITIYMCCLLCLAGFTEYYLREKGYACEVPDSIKAEIENFDYDIGYVPINRHRTYTTPAQETYPDGFAATITRWGDAARASYPAPRKPTKKKVLLVGCSFTMGEGVEDYETYAWHLNNYYHDYTFENHAMNGYGTYQSYLYEKKILEQHQDNDYDLVIYSAIRDHFKRNVTFATMYFEEHILAPSKTEDSTQSDPLLFQDPISQMWIYPTAYLKSDKTLGYNPAVKHWPGDERSSTINFMKHLYWFCHSVNLQKAFDGDIEPQESVDVFSLLLDNMNDCAQQHGAKFAVVYLENEKYGPISQIHSDKYPVIYATDGREGEEDNPSFHVAQEMGYHPNGIVHKNWAKHIHEGLEKEGLLSACPHDQPTVKVSTSNAQPPCT